MRPLRTTLAVTALALAAVAVAACAPTPSGGGHAATTVAPTTTAVAPTPPPYEPLPNPPAIGRLKFYNAAGVQITGGNVSDAPFAAYVQSSVAGRAGDTKATLYGYLPKSGVPYDGWSGELLTASPNYPNPSAPSALAASPLPLVSVTSGDFNVSQLAADFPNSATGAYQGLYQLRLKTSGPGQQAGANYSIADIKVTGTTWSVVY